jgi:hypothetical protein
MEFTIHCMKFAYLTTNYVDNYLVFRQKVNKIATLKDNRH